MLGVPCPLPLIGLWVGFGRLVGDGGYGPAAGLVFVDGDVGSVWAGSAVEVGVG